ncbi:hypothetical protein DFH27DRAFT_481182 [Peziza echinospora]|nr:hypothetical protein DFH27DRAFT_481182 [Peziza echinospora]
MQLSLPESRILSPKVRRAAVTPPSVTPPSVTTDISSLQQLERDRCKSPCSQRASALLAKVAYPAMPQPTAPILTGAGLPSPSLSHSNSSTPASSPPGEGDQFSFGSFPKELPASPNGGYISFPCFEQFDNCSDDEDSDHKKR